jgi:hypothetical protein
MSTKIKLRRGNNSQWNSNSNIVLASGEPGLELDTGRLKIGNGVLSWGSLPYSFILPTGFKPGTNIGLDYDGSNNTLTISATGSAGEAGSQGVQGFQGIQGSKINWTGTWDTAKNYNIDDIVSIEGSSYICISSHLSSSAFLTDILKWQLLAKSGSQGVNGSNGTQGANGLSIQGSAGSQGIQGPAGGGSVGDGSQGIQGIQGSEGLGFTWLGDWDIGEEAYVPRDVVNYEGSSYVCILETPGNDYPPPFFLGVFWDLLAAKGVQGTIGSQGFNGVQGISGPVAGSINQIIYKDSSNLATGSENLLFDGTKLISNSGSFYENITLGRIGNSSPVFGSDVKSNNVKNSLLYITSDQDDKCLIDISSIDKNFFNITNSISGSIFSINDSGGIPVFETLSNSTTRIGRYNQNDFVVNPSGNIGIGTNNPVHKLQVNGSFVAKSKSFRIKHPSKNNHILEYGSLESPYHGVRLTGRGVIKNGYCEVKLPEYIKDLIIDDDSVNIQLTSLNHSKLMYVHKINLNDNVFEVKSDRSKSIKKLNFFWTFTGIRKDIDSLVPEQKGNL